MKIWSPAISPTIHSLPKSMPELWRRLCRIVFPPLNAIHRHSLKKTLCVFWNCGAGTGKFSYLFLRKLTALLRNHERTFAPCALLHDRCSVEAVTKWRENAYLQEFVSSGILEFEILQAGQEHKLTAQRPARRHRQLCF